MKTYSFILFICIFTFVSCKEETLPKPKAQLRLNYPNPNYISTQYSDCPFNFEINAITEVKSKGFCNFELHYPKMKATIYVNYHTVTNNNIDSLLRDAQKLTYDHAIKADEITSQPFINTDKRVYGMFSEVGGNVATNAQFYVTDSTKNFIVGSMYFYAKPNYDSIYPAASYIKDDIRKLMETIEWRK